MHRLIRATLGAAAVLVLSAGAAVAGPKDSTGKTCTAGIGKPVCCKTYVANHCDYVPCCEVGNAGFFSQKLCSMCASRVEGRARVARISSTCTVARDPMAGNAPFFTASAVACEKGACGESAACGAKVASSSCCAVKSAKAK